jgi:hypothetical protein
MAEGLFDQAVVEIDRLVPPEEEPSIYGITSPFCHNGNDNANGMMGLMGGEERVNIGCWAQVRG